MLTLTVNPGITRRTAAYMSFIPAKGYTELCLNETNQSELLLGGFWGEGCLHRSSDDV